MSSRQRLAVAATCLLAGAASTLLAVDVLRWQGRMQSGDTNFASGSARSDSWTPPRLVPFGAAKELLDLGDDLAYRSAVREFVLSRPRDQPYSDTELIAKRGHAQELLAALVDRDEDPGRRAAAANLIGVLGFASAAIDPSQAPSYLTAAIARFRQAIVLDPQTSDAKYNLELALARLPAAKAASGSDARRSTRGGAGSGSGAGRPGSGY